MGETCRIAQVPPHTLRYWESHFGSLKPARRSSGHRRYTQNDLKTIFSIKDLLQRRRMTIAGARRALIDRKKGAAGWGEAAADGEAPSAMKLLREVKKEIKALVEEFAK